MEDRTDDPHQPTRPLPPGDRAWQHPSERGLEVRQHVDRRRGSRMAMALLLTGTGALVAAAVVGRAGRTDVPPMDASSRIGPTVATIAVTDGGRTDMVTGVTLDTSGDVLVRASLVVGADRLRAGCAGARPSVARLVARDDLADLAVVRIVGRPCRAAVPDRDQQRVGQAVLAVRSDADGASLMWRDGTVRATDTDVVRRDGTVDHRVFRTDASGIEPRGDGLVFDQDGEFMGMVAGGPGDGREVPVRPAASLVATAEALAEGRPVEHPWIGVTAEDRPVVEPSTTSAPTTTVVPAPSDPTGTPADGDAATTAEAARPAAVSGCVLTALDEDGPAAQAGLLPGDVVLQVDGVAVVSVAGLARAVHDRQVGATLSVTVRRGEATLTRQVRIAEQPAA